MPKKVKSNYKIFVKHFSGRITNCMEDYMKQSLLKDPNHIMLYVGKNELILDRSLQDIATSLVNLACSMKGEKCDVNILNIILKNDNKKFILKGQEVNTHLKDMCKKKTFTCFITPKKSKHNI